MEASLSEVGSLEEGAELLDVHFAQLLWVGNTPEQPVILDRERQIELPDALLELADRNDAGLGVEWVIKAMEAVEEADVSLLEESYDSAFQGLHPLGLGMPEVLGISPALFLDLSLHLFAVPGKLCTVRVIIHVLLLDNGLLAHVLNDFIKSLFEVEELHEVTAQINATRA